MSVLSEIHHGLRSEWSVLESQWRSTRSQWSDGVADYFEKEFWQELEDGVPTFLRELEHVDETLAQALRALDR
jgi:hypothetical protein